MRRLTLTLAACLLTYLTSPAASLAAQPTFAQPRLAETPASGLTIEERLEAIERQVHMIQLHLGLGVAKPIDDQGNWPVAAVSGGRISTLESESRRIEERLAQAESRLKEVESQSTPLASKPSQGKFVILNHSGVSRYISVNGMRFYAAPGRTELWIPRGIVEAYLPHWESPKLLGTSFWRWTGQHYEMSLHIRS